MRSLTNGFTLIELIIVFSLLGILSVSGLATFNTFNKNQILKNAANELVNTLQTAKVRAQSQVKDSRCLNTDTLNYWYVETKLSKSGTSYVPDNTKYQLAISCAPNAYSARIITLPNGIVFTSQYEVAFYHILDGGIVYWDGDPPATNAAAKTITIKLSNGSTTIPIQLTQDGRIIVLPSTTP